MGTLPGPWAPGPPRSLRPCLMQEKQHQGALALLNHTDGHEVSAGSHGHKARARPCLHTSAPILPGLGMVSLPAQSQWMVPGDRGGSEFLAEGGACPSQVCCGCRHEEGVLMGARDADGGQDAASCHLGPWQRCTQSMEKPAGGVG